MINERRETSVTTGSNNSMKTITKYQLTQYMSYGWEGADTEIEQTFVANSVRFFKDNDSISKGEYILSWH